MVEQKSQDITEDEATLYDRQIRLWGLNSQKRLRAAKILVIGMKGLGAEVCKNIILAGVKSVTMMDHRVATEQDLSYQFLVPQDHVGKNLAEASLERARQLNPMVDITANTSNIKDTLESDSFFTAFDVIVATQCTIPDICALNRICRLNGIKFFASDVFGFYGYTFSDLQIHEYSYDMKAPYAGKKSKDAPPVVVTKKVTATFVPFQDLIHIDWTADEMKPLLKKMGPGFFILRVLQDFRAHEGHDPKRNDISKLKETRDATLKQLGVDLTLVTDETLNRTFSQVSPVCAIVGGVLAQEVIKGVAQRDTPFNNCFFFDPDTCSGTVECIGA